jgi:hypothetical protein
LKNGRRSARFALADILLHCWIDFGGQVGQPLDAANTAVIPGRARSANPESRDSGFARFTRAPE